MREDPASAITSSTTLPKRVRVVRRAGESVTRAAKEYARNRRGGVLLELLLAMALFVGGAILVLGAMRSAIDGARRTDLRARAMDLAQSRLAELDAGLVAIGDFDGGVDDEEGSAGAHRDPELDVSLEILPIGAGDGVRLARATVRARDVGGDGGGTIITTIDRVIAAEDTRREGGSP